MNVPGARPAPALGVLAVLGAAVLLVVSARTDGLAAEMNGDAARLFLAKHLGVTEAEFRRLAQGQVVSRSLDAADRREIATKGIVRIGVDPETYLERLADIVGFKRHEAVLEIGVFSDSPAAADLRELTLDRGDVRDLRSCRVGNCDLKLPAEAIARFQQQVAWNAPDAEEQANALMRRLLASYVADYMARGDAALMQYASRSRPMDVAAEFQALVESDDGLLKEFPTLTRYLENYPREPRDGVRDLIYWSREKPGPSPVISITHMIKAAGPRGSPVHHAVMSRQIYGSKYFEASMGLTLLLPDTTAGMPATYVVYLNRTRLDVFSGLFGGIVKRTVRSRVRSGMADSLARVKTALERPAPALTGHR